jgi:hypothetical protein
MIFDEIKNIQIKKENLIIDNTIAISSRKEKINSLQIKYNEILNMINQYDNNNEKPNEYLNLDLDQTKKEMEYLHLEIEFLENRLQDEMLLMNKEIESFINQKIPEDTILDYNFINKYKLINLDDILGVLTKYDFNSEDLKNYEYNNYIIEYVSVNFPHKKFFINNIKKNVMTHYNGIEIDTKFYKYCYGLSFDVNSKDIFKKLNTDGIYDGHIYSTKQIENLFGEHLKFYEVDEKIVFYYNENYLDCRELINQINNLTFNNLINNLEILENNIEEDFKMMTCCFIANYEKGVTLLNKVSNLKNCICCLIFNSKELYEQFVYLKEIPNLIVFLTRECGSDIIPSLQAINFMINNYNIEYIYKFHTKSDDKIFNETTDFLINKPVEELINGINYDVCNCIGNPKFLINLNHDAHNILSYEKYSNNLSMNKSFIGSTIFFASVKVFKSVINFIKNNDYKSFFINNMYDTNLVNFNNSPSHLLERLFGVINLNE